MNIKTKFFHSLKLALVFFLMHLYSELLLYDSVNPQDQGFGVWIVLYLISIALFESAFLHISQNEIVSRIIACIIAAFISVYYIAQYIYFRTFGSLISVGNIALGGNALRNFGWTIKDIVASNILDILLLLAPFLIILVTSIFVKRLKLSGFGLKSFAVLLLASVLVWVCITAALPIEGKDDYTVYGAYHSQFVDTDTASKKLGAFTDTIVETKIYLFGGKTDEFVDSGEIDDEPDDPVVEIDTSPNTYKGLAFAELSGKTNDKTIKKLCDYLSKEKGTNKNEYTGFLKDYNLVYICAEAFSTAAIDKDVTPTLYRLANGGIVLNNYYNSFPNTTTNGEYALLTGIWPDVSRSASRGKLNGSMPSSSKLCMYPSLGNVLNDQRGVQPLGFHNYLGYYYGREDSLPNMGFKCKFMNEGMTFTTSWPSSDYEMMQQSVCDYVNSDEPFCAYYMTFSGHGSYIEGNFMYDRNIEDVLSYTKDRHWATTASGYLACNKELDKALEYLLSELEANGKLENTLIVIAGDHFPYYMTDLAYKQMYGYEKDPDFGMFKSTCIMWTGSMEENPLYVDDYCCNVDILPTVLNLLGVDFDSRLYAGRDIFSTTQHMAILYNKNFITDKVRYNNETGEAIWSSESDTMSEDEKNAYLENCKNIVKNRYQASINFGECDFYGFVFDNYTVDTAIPPSSEISNLISAQVNSLRFSSSLFSVQYRWMPRF